MILFRKHKPGELMFGACADADAPAIMSMLKDGFTAERYADDVLAEELVFLSIDELEIRHALALSCADVWRNIGGIASQTAVAGNIDEFETGERLADDVKRKVYFALLDWGDGFNPGEALLINHARDNVRIERREGWKR